MKMSKGSLGIYIYIIRKVVVVRWQQDKNGKEAFSSDLSTHVYKLVWILRRFAIGLKIDDVPDD